MQNKLSNEEKLNQIFFPHNTQRRQDAIKGQHFVYYTSAETAISIIRNKQIWMRNALYMNDSSEVRYGIECLRHAYLSLAGQRFKESLDEIFPNICNEIAAKFHGWSGDFRNGTYLTCLSEFSDPEDNHGRLSMWRAYGGESGVALVLNNEGLLSLSGSCGLKGYISPVAYKSKEGIEEEINNIMNNIKDNAEMLRTQNREAIKNLVFNAFRFAAVSIKNPGFNEEKEWRIIYSPNMEPEASIHIEKEIRQVNEITQLIYKIPLREIPEDGIKGLDIPNLINRIIIGTYSKQISTYNVFVELLENAGVADPYKRVTLSNIPPIR